MVNGNRVRVIFFPVDSHGDNVPWRLETSDKRFGSILTNNETLKHALIGMFRPRTILEELHLRVPWFFLGLSFVSKFQQICGPTCRN
jgi:hypothetical protein